MQSQGIWVVLSKLYQPSFPFSHVLLKNSLTISTGAPLQIDDTTRRTATTVGEMSAKDSIRVCSEPIGLPNCYLSSEIIWLWRDNHSLGVLSLLPESGRDSHLQTIHTFVLVIGVLIAYFVECNCCLHLLIEQRPLLDDTQIQLQVLLLVLCDTWVYLPVKTLDAGVLKTLRDVLFLMI